MLDPLPAGQTERDVAKNSVSRRFVALTRARLTAWLAQPLDGLDVRVVLIDGLHFRDHVILLGLGDRGRAQARARAPRGHYGDAEAFCPRRVASGIALVDARSDRRSPPCAEGVCDPPRTFDFGLFLP